MMTQRMSAMDAHRVCTAHARRRATSRASTVSVRRVSSSATNDDVDWEEKTKEFTSERVLESCLSAMASGDEDALEACLLEVDTELESTEVSTKTIETLRARPEVKGDAFWTQKLKELSAERVFEDCMTAVMRGDADEVEACILDAESDELLQ